MEGISFEQFIQTVSRQKYKICYARVPNKSYIFVSTVGLVDVGMNEVFTISRSSSLDDAYVLINYIVKRLMETNQNVGVRRDLIRHPKTQEPLRYLIRKAKDIDSTLLIIGPDENNVLPGEKGYKAYL